MVREIIEYCLDIIPIIISFLALIMSLNVRKSQKRESKPSFSLVQNLWTESPYFELINEADSKLDKIPSPSYLMSIPSKVYFYTNNGECYSLLVLSPISYDVVLEQIVTGATKKQIVTSKLPTDFSAKKGDRDIICSDWIEGDENLKIRINTYPFLVIFSDVQYSYNKKEYHDILLSTSLESRKIDKDIYLQIKEYMKDNYRHEVKLSKNTNIYRKTNTQVVETFKNPKGNEEFFCGKKGGYKNVFKLINKMITPMTPLDE